MRSSRGRFDDTIDFAQNNEDTATATLMAREAHSDATALGPPLTSPGPRVERKRLSLEIGFLSEEECSRGLTIDQEVGRDEDRALHQDLQLLLLSYCIQAT